MAKFIIKGGKPLSGEVQIYGAKNAVLPQMAAAILAHGIVKLDNVPQIIDVKIMSEILEDLGAKIKNVGNHSLEIDPSGINKSEIDKNLARRLRASVLLVGSLIAKFGKVKLPFPGGDIIGRRSLDTHMKAFETMGASISRENDHYLITAKNLKPAEIYLDETSVTATENIIMAAVFCEGETIIRFAAAEPHVVDLCEMLNKMGAQISGLGTNTVKIKGVKSLSGTDHKIVPDQIDAVTFSCAGIVTKGEVTIKGINREILYPILHKFDQMNVNYEMGKDSLTVKKSELRAAKIQTSPWPGFPTDSQPPFTVLATQSQGISLIHDWMYERRLLYIDELIKMGADITLCDPHRILVSGPTRLRGTKLFGPDIRAGVALVIAALAARGETEIDNVELIDRGYERIEERLKSLGADIVRSKE
ncbi:MAG: UDP-N-acetylglucosamine 1-carboxyvinyltransferase [Candidatus Bathyarchaeota archaeon]|nr:UDP-N-acetylglucosamine 1-carboxyvinyltransferase [Candidatus Bathyarchaeota archaeon]